MFNNVNKYFILFFIKMNKLTIKSKSKSFWAIELIMFNINYMI